MDIVARANQNLDAIRRGAGDDAVDASLWFAMLEPEHAAVVPSLSAALSDDCDEVVSNALCGLEVLREAACEAISHVIAVIGHSNRQVQLAAIRTLGAIAPGSRKAARTLYRRFEQSDAEETVAIACALARVAPQSDIVAAKVILLSGDSELQIRRGATYALGYIRTSLPQVISALRPRLRDEVPPLREVALEAVARLGPLAKEAVSSLVHLLGHPELVPRDKVLRSLTAIGSSAAESIPALLPMLTSPDWTVANPAAIAIAAMGEAGRNELFTHLLHADPWTRKAVIHGLRSLILGCTPEIRAMLEKVLALRGVAESDPEVRDTIADALDALRQDKKPDRQKAK